MPMGNHIVFFFILFAATTYSVFFFTFIYHRYRLTSEDCNCKCWWEQKIKNSKKKMISQMSDNRVLNKGYNIFIKDLDVLLNTQYVYTSVRALIYQNNHRSALLSPRAPTWQSSRTVNSCLAVHFSGLFYSYFCCSTLKYTCFNDNVVYLCF